MTLLGGSSAWPHCCGPSADELRAEAQNIEVHVQVPCKDELARKTSYSLCVEENPKDVGSDLAKQYVIGADPSMCSTRSSLGHGSNDAATDDAAEEQQKPKSSKYPIPSPPQLEKANTLGSSGMEFVKRCSSPQSAGSSAPMSEMMKSTTLRQRAKQVGRRMTAHVTTRFSNMYRRQSTLGTASQNTPSEMRPEDFGVPIFTEHLKDVNMAQVRAAFVNDEGCPVHNFLREALGCYDIMATAWRDCDRVAGVRVRKSCYTMAVPDDVPASVRRLCNIPDIIVGSAVVRFQDRGEDIVLAQHSYTHDVLYGDRFKVQNMLRFRPDPSEGIVIQQWVCTLWEKPMPWTHGMVKMFIEKKVIADAVKMAPKFGAAVRKSVALETSMQEEGDVHS